MAASIWVNGWFIGLLLGALASIVGGRAPWSVIALFGAAVALSCAQQFAAYYRIVRRG